MMNITSTEAPPVTLSNIEMSKKINIPTSKIGWLHSISDEPGVTFDLQIKELLK